MDDRPEMSAGKAADYLANETQGNYPLLVEALRRKAATEAPKAGTPTSK